MHSSNLVSIGILVNGTNLMLSNELCDTKLLPIDEMVDENKVYCMQGFCCVCLV